MKSISHDDGFTGLILADDLTGACDAAAPFAARMHVRVALNSERVPEAEVVAINLRSRDIAAAAARTKLQSAAQLVRDRKPQLLLKKIDSAFRGNTFEEIAICL
ncbi:MAG: four-carbon acid sugar kinase family protein, partial [Edaphobacter sp.]